MHHRIRLLPVLLLFTFACKPVDQPLSSIPSETRDLASTARFGFELNVPTRFLNDGWDVYTWDVEAARTDRYRSLRLTPRFVLIVEAPLSEAGGTIAYRVGPTSDITGSKKPVLRLRVYDDVPGLTFSALADTIRFVGHPVVDWDLNGTHVKEILHSQAGGYAHASAAIPSLIARHADYLYFFDFYTVRPEAEARSRQVVAGFRTNFD